MSGRALRQCLGCGLLGLVTSVAVAWGLSLREQMRPQRPAQIAIGQAVVDDVIVKAAVKRQAGLIHQAWELIDTTGDGLLKDYHRAIAFKTQAIGALQQERRRDSRFDRVLNWANFGEIISTWPVTNLRLRETEVSSADEFARRGSPIPREQIAYDTTCYRRLATGWPLPALRLTERLDHAGVAPDADGVPTAIQSQWSSRSAIATPWQRRMLVATTPPTPPFPALLPLEPRPGLLVNTALFALLWFGLLRLPHAIRRARRRRRGLCPDCGYDLTGLEGPCPECGATR